MGITHTIFMLQHNAIRTGDPDVRVGAESVMLCFECVGRDNKRLVGNEFKLSLLKASSA